MSGWYDAHLVLVQGTFINLLLALSVQVSFRLGVFSFSGIGCFGLGAYVAGIMTIHASTPAVISVLGAMAVSAAVSYGLALLLARLGGLYLGMATIAFTLIVGVVAVNGGSLTGGVTGLFGILASIPLGTIIGFVLIAIVLLAFSERGPLGRRVEAVREDPELAAATGTNVRRYRQAAFVASGLLGGCAGALNTLVRTTVGPNDIGFSLVVLALTMVIIGGNRSWAGALIGAVIFTWLPTILSSLGEWQSLVYGTLVAIAAIYLPGGLFGVMTDAWRKWQRRRTGTPKAPSRQASGEDCGHWILPRQAREVPHDRDAGAALSRRPRRTSGARSP
jgi:branched-chain amino acid transport system permease protein